MPQLGGSHLYYNAEGALTSAAISQTLRDHALAVLRASILKEKLPEKITYLDPNGTPHLLTPDNTVKAQVISDEMSLVLMPTTQDIQKFASKPKRKTYLSTETAPATALNYLGGDSLKEQMTLMRMAYDHLLDTVGPNPEAFIDAQHQVDNLNKLLRVDMDKMLKVKGVIDPDMRHESIMTALKGTIQQQLEKKLATMDQDQKTMFQQLFDECQIAYEAAINPERVAQMHYSPAPEYVQAKWQEAEDKLANGGKLEKGERARLQHKLDSPSPSAQLAAMSTEEKVAHMGRLIDEDLAREAQNATPSPGRIN